jgi:uncharacterized protein YoxC
MIEETVTTRALKFGRSHYKVVAAWIVAGVTTGANVFIAIGHRQSDSAVVAASVTQLVSKVDGLTDKVNTQSADIAGMTAKVDMIHDDVQGFKAWKDRVTGVAETVSVPKLQSHRHNGR